MPRQKCELQPLGIDLHAHFSSNNDSFFYVLVFEKMRLQLIEPRQKTLHIQFRHGPVPNRIVLGAMQIDVGGRRAHAVDPSEGSP